MMVEILAELYHRYNASDVCACVCIIFGFEAHWEKLSFHSILRRGAARYFAKVILVSRFKQN
jgi:hypothetical protein